MTKPRSVSRDALIAEIASAVLSCNVTTNTELLGEFIVEGPIGVLIWSGSW